MATPEQQQQRHELLNSVSLEALLDQWCAAPHGRHRGKWVCPVHDGQTHKTPPVSLYVNDAGEEAWRCHSCGAGGSAFDLVQACQGGNFVDAWQYLAGRRFDPVRRPSPADRVAANRPRALLEPARDYLVACREALWAPHGEPGRRWLAARGITNEALLRRCGVGFDPGKARLARGEGLPPLPGGPDEWDTRLPDGRCRAITFPALTASGHAVSFQARLLGDDQRYLSAHSAVAPPLPNMSFVRGAADNGAPVAVCEGPTDAFAAAMGGYRSIAILGAGNAAPRALAHNDVLAGILRHAMRGDGPPRVVVCGDNDKAGAAFNDSLREHLLGAGIDTVIGHIPDTHKDLNSWLIAADPATIASDLDAEGPTPTPLHGTVAVSANPAHAPQPRARRPDGDPIAERELAAMRDAELTVDAL